jgi:membrane protein required for colicin V production
MNGIDWLILAVVAASLAIGAVRGFTREIVSLTGWVVGALLAIHFAAAVGDALPFDIAWSSVRVAAGALVIVLGCVVVASIVAWVLSRILLAAKMTLTDRLWGALFGVLRGAVIVLVAVLFLRDTTVAQHALWKQSFFVPHAEAAVRFASPWLADVVERARPR